MRDNALWIQRISAACLLGSMGSATLAAREPGLVDRSPQRIIGGAPTDSYSHPAVVYLAAGGWFCTGSLIDELFVLTAAHCVVDGDGSVENPAGIVVERGYPEAYQRLDRGTVEEVLVHPEYAWHGAGFVNDVALLRLRVGFPSEIEPMEIASPIWRRRSSPPAPRAPPPLAGGERRTMPGATISGRCGTQRGSPESAATGFRSRTRTRSPTTARSALAGPIGRPPRGIAGGRGVFRGDGGANRSLPKQIFGTYLFGAECRETPFFALGALPSSSDGL